MAVVSSQLPVVSKEAVGSSLSLTTDNCLRTASERGVILIALLWILTALSVIALSFSRETFVEVAAARNMQSLEDSYFVARAGFEAAIYQLIQRRYAPASRQTELLDATDPLELGIVTGTLGGSVYRVDIQDESGKISLNTVSEEQLRNLIEAAGIGKPDSAVITDSILDWRDTDSNPRPNGAEEDYYQMLNPPYKARNGRIDTVEEFLLIRGMTTEYFYGRPEKDATGSIVYRYGLSRYLTVYSNNSQQVNINFAPLPVLQSITGMPPEAAQAIYERRRIKPFKNPQEISRDLGISLGAPTMQYLGVMQTDFYTLTASARPANSKARRVVRSIVSLQPIANKLYRTLYWNENIPDYEGMTP
jgi:general secretion pathway protein K